MIFSEQKRTEDFLYKTEDVFGEVELTSKIRLTPAILDSCVLRLMKGDLITGVIRDDKNNNDISFKFSPASPWSEDKDLLDNK